MYGDNATKKNGLEVSIDWIAFTSVEVKDEKEIFEFLGYQPEDFLVLPKGANGYMKVYRLKSYPVTVMSEGSSDMGVHVVITGSAIRDVMEHYGATLKVDTPFRTKAFSFSELGSNVMAEFLHDISRMGWLTRLDLAIDDKGCNYFSVEDLREHLDAQDIVSKFRTFRDVDESMLTGDKTGHTIYLGSRQSELMLRVYDKRLEQNRKIEQEQDKLQEPWVRWEFELKNERANIAADMLVKQMPLGEVVTGILNNYVRIIIHDDSNRTRCSSHPLWQKFVDTVNQLKLFVPALKKTIKEKRRWLIRSVMPTLAGVIIADGGSFDIITEHFYDAAKRMNNHMKYLVTQENPGWQITLEQLSVWSN